MPLPVWSDGFWEVMPVLESFQEKANPSKIWRVGRISCFFFFAIGD